MKSAETKIKQLTALLKMRDEKLQSLVTTINKLEEVTKENEMRLEHQRHELNEQNAVLQEVFVVLKEFGISSIGGPYLRSNGLSQEFWVLRKNLPNLVVVTKPYIHQIIGKSVGAGLISENVGQCATKCPFSGHDCTDGFYKALQMKVRETPHALEGFLLLVQNLQVSGNVQQLCSTMLKEMQACSYAS